MPYRTNAQITRVQMVATKEFRDRFSKWTRDHNLTASTCLHRLASMAMANQIFPAPNSTTTALPPDEVFHLLLVEASRTSDVKLMRQVRMLVERVKAKLSTQSSAKTAPSK